MISGFLRGAAAATVAALVLTACGGGGGSTGGGVSVFPTTSPPPPGQSTPYSCPSSATSFGVGSSGVASASAVHRMVRTHGPTLNAGRAVLAVTYADGRAPELVDVDGQDLATVRARLRAKPGVASVTQAQKRYALTRSATFTNDPFFEGAKGTSAPLYQTASTAGQWDMHVIELEHAFSYSLGSSAVKLAVIDTGEDVTQPDLAAAHVVRTGCFITDATGKTQSVGTFVTDPDGHGTDVSGIAGAAINNGFGFAGAGGAISLMLYRVFPTPNDSCNDPNSQDA
ncbi:MAG TPA: S8 family serine peptidase, partial [Candidatus Aquilonibacter sp.]|nr:S8 family serine peptidase [Candidatus Aquilonibacter sp.]